MRVRLKKYIISDISGNIVYEGYDFHVALKYLISDEFSSLREKWFICEVPSGFSDKVHEIKEA